MTQVSEPVSIPLSIKLTYLAFYLTNLFHTANRYTYVPLQNDIASRLGIAETKLSTFVPAYYYPFVAMTLIYGYFGDKIHNRKLLICSCLTLEVLALFGVAFSSSYYVFFLCRVLQGAAGSCFPTLQAALIADMFSGKTRSVLLGIFYTSSGIGIGLGQGLMPFIAAALGNSKALCLFAVIQFAVVAIYFIFLPNIKRPKATNSDEEVKGLVEGSPKVNEEKFLDQIKKMLTKKSLWFCYLASAATVSFIETGLLFAQEFLRRLVVVLSYNYEYFGYKEPLQPACVQDFYYPVENSTLTFENVSVCENSSGIQNLDYNISVQVNCDTCNAEDIASKFGLIAVSAGFIGVLLAIMMSMAIKKVTDRNGPITCAIGAIVTTIVMVIMTRFLDFKPGNYNDLTTSWVILFFGFTGLGIYVAISPDIITSVVPANYRGKAVSLQIVFERLIGTGIPPVVAGMQAENFDAEWICK